MLKLYLVTIFKYVCFSARVLADIIGGLLAIVILLGFLALAGTWVYDICIFTELYFNGEK
jgi:hypothetical protein